LLAQRFKMLCRRGFCTKGDAHRENTRATDSRICDCANTAILDFLGLQEAPDTGVGRVPNEIVLAR
jgi:hypothetical protein